MSAPLHPREKRRLKILVCGSRNWGDMETIAKVVDGFPDDAVVINGLARGADKMARTRAVQRGLFVADVPVLPSHWNRYNRAAGHKRNAAMLALEPDLVVAFSTGTGGTQGTIDGARSLGIRVEVVGREVDR